MKLILPLVLIVAQLSACGPRKPSMGRTIPCDPQIKYGSVIDGAGRYGSTVRYGEMVSCLPTVYLPRYLFFPIYAIRVDLRAGDVIKAYAEFEVTNDTNIGVMVASQIILTRDLQFRSPGWVAVTQHNGFNVTPEMHHGFTTKIGSVRLVESFSGYLVLFAWAGSESNPNTSIKVEPGYGQLQYVIYRD